MAAIKANETAAEATDPAAALDKDLAALDAGAETPADRETRLRTFLVKHFDDVPAAALPLAVKRCILFEDGCRELFDEPDLQLGDEDAVDPELKAAIDEEVARKSEVITANAAAIAEREAAAADRAVAVETNERETIPAAEAELAAAKSDTIDLTARAADRERVEAEERQRNAEVNRDLTTVKDLQANFEKLKAKHGTVAALKSLLDAETGVKSPEMRAIVQRAVATAEALVTALPGKEAVVSRLLDGAGLNLAAGSTAETFAGFLAAVEASDDLTEAEKTTLRNLVKNEVEPPTNATDLQDKLAKGRGTETVTETQRVEEPPGSGNFVEKEVVVSERALPFTEDAPLTISENPRIVIFPVEPGSERHCVKAAVDGGEPITLYLNIPKEGALPTDDINRFIVAQQARALMSNRGLSGVMSQLLGTGDGTLVVGAESEFHAIGQGDTVWAVIRMLRGEDLTTAGRFLTGDDLATMEHNLRWLTPGGDFGAFNQLDPASANGLARAMFGDGATETVASMDRARPFINTGGAEAPSFEALYARMYPDDAANGFARLRGIIGDKGIAGLSLPGTGAADAGHPDRAV